MNDIVTITDNYAEMAKVMGIANEGGSPQRKQASTLARLRIHHTPIMGEAEVKGKSMNVEVVSGGMYKLEIPDGETYYASSAKIRPFMQRFMYKRFVMASGSTANRYIKTVMADNLNIDLKDSDGKFNCGKPAGWIADFKALPDKTQELLKQIKRVRVVFGVVDLVDATNEKGESVKIDSQPFIWEIDNRDAFKTMGIPFTKLSQMKRLPVQHNITLNTEERKLPNGNSFYLPTASLDISKTIELADSDQDTFANFLAWVENYNSYIINEWDVQAGQKYDAEDNAIVGDFIDIEEEVA
jgi:hypothetical protein